jgi:hypothetical protein
MNYQYLALRCHCGEVPENLAEVGFTGDHQLVIHWWCPECKKVVYIAKSLVECWQECPASDEPLDVALQQWQNSQQIKDDEFLHSIGVKM